MFSDHRLFVVSTDAMRAALGPIWLWVTCVCLSLVLSAAEPVEFKPGSIYTFRQPGKAFVEYMPKWSNRQRWGIAFSFRTHKANTMLLQNSFILDAAKADLWITLEKGQLNVKHVFNEDNLSLACGKGLSHDHWHDAQVDVDLKMGNVTCTVNGRDSVVATLRSEVVAQARSVLVDDIAPSHTAVTSVGGFSPDSLEAPSHFVGCIGNVTFFQDGRPFPVTFHRKEGVDLECLDLCDSDNPCVHGGRCINHYLKVSCDCFGTGFEGSHCNRKGSSAVTLQGSEWITYIIYDSNGKAHSPVNKVALEFKTRATEGVLFFGYSQTQYNHLAVSLRNASLHVSVVFVDSKNYDELWLPVGSNLNDDRWHRVTVNHHGREVTVTLDSHTEKMTASEGHQHLHMDPAVYFGGTEKAHTGKGLRSQRNFVGCLRSLYFNHNSILERTEAERAKFHGTNPQLGCQDMNQRILQFTHQGSFVKVEHSASEGLEVKLQFRTLKADAVLVYALAHSGGDDGYIQVLLRSGQVQVLVVPSVSRPNIKQSATTGESLNDNQWHILQLKYEEGTTQIEVDGEQSIASFPWKIKLSRATFLGFGPDSKMKYGFVGCMQEIHVQETKVRPVEVVHSQLGVGVSLGPCALRDWCALNGSFCLNGGHCVNIWEDTYCDCSHTQYEGKFCQFAKLLRTCDEYFQQSGEAGQRSGVWTVDVDGSGPLAQSHVYCEMGVMRDGARFGTTWVSHNLDGATPVRGPSLEDLKKLVKYREMETNQLQNLVKISGFCQQYLQVNCSQAHLRLGDLTWLVSANGKTFTSLGGAPEGACECFLHSDCLDNQRCNCDAEGAGATWDGGFLSDRSHLPVTELVFKQEMESTGIANVTMGPLKCLGTRGDELTSAVTFMQPEVFLQLESWCGGEIRFDFQTRQPDAVLLYQPEEQTKGTGSSGRLLNRWKDAQLYILLRKGTTLVVMFEGMDLWQTVTSQVPLNNGKWQHVVIEIIYGQLRVTLNRQHFISDLPERATGVINSPQPLYLGGKPRTNINDLRGFIGCMRGLTYNGVMHELGPIANKPGISLGCSPACSSDPCANGAICEEQWSSYSCKCLNSFAQSGRNCEIDINTDAISFLTSRGFIKITQETSEELIQQEVIMSFRSLQPGSVLLYIQDHLNNFLQVEIPDNVTLSITYNSGDIIIHKNLTIHGIVDGTWKQLAILPDKDKMMVNFDGSEVEVDHPWNMLTEYSTKPFKMQETIVPYRAPGSESPAYTVYLGGVAGAMSSIRGFVGCLRGVKVAGTVIDLHKVADVVDGVQKECPDGCTSNPCMNHGSCVEGVALDGFYTCNCINTGFAGTYCDKEVGLYFGGMSYIMMILRTASPEVMVAKDVTSSSSRTLGTRDSLHFNFATYNSADQHSRAMVLVQSEHDYIVVYLSSDGRVFAEYLIDGFSVLLESDVHYTTGWPHHVTLTRKEGHVSLKVDHSIIQQEINSTLLMEKPIRIIVGGALDVDGQLSYLVNFTGDISNVFYTSDWLIGVSGRPLDAYYGLTVDTPDQVTISGPVHDATQVLGGPTVNLGPQVFDTEPQDTSPQMYSFPPWKVGPAQTIKLVETEGGAGARDLRPGDIAAIAASLTFLILIAVTIAFLLRRVSHRCKATTDPRKNDDEEEGLMGIAYRRKTSGDEVPPPADVRSKPRNGRGKKLLASEETLDDFEDEETPMLSVMEEPVISDPPPNNSIEMSPFSNIMDKIPMIDEDSEDEVTPATEDHSQPVPMSVQSSQLTPTDSNSLSGCSIEPDSSLSSSVQLEWDHHADVSSPLGNVERRKQQQQRQPEEHHPQQYSPKTEMRESRGRKVAPTSPETSSASNAFQGASVRKPGAPAEVWTESQVLDFLDSDSPSDDTVGEPSWDPSADALVEMKDEEEAETDALATVHSSCRQGDDNRNNNAAPSTHYNPLMEDNADSKTIDCSALSGLTLECEKGQADPCGTPQTAEGDQGPHVEPNVIVVHNNNSDDTDNATSLYPSDLSCDGDDAIPQTGSDIDNSVYKQNVLESSEEHSSDSDTSEDGVRNCSSPRSKLKLNTDVRPLTPPMGRSPGITQSKGKLKLKAKKNLKGKK